MTIRSARRCIGLETFLGHRSLACSLGLPKGLGLRLSQLVDGRRRSRGKFVALERFSILEAQLACIISLL